MQLRFPLSRLALAVTLAAGAGSAGAQTVLAQHQGATNPLDQGWELAADTGGLAGEVLDGGAPAWSVVDSSTAAGLLYYRHELDATTLTAGWSMQARVRVTQTHATAFGSPFFGVNVGGLGYNLYFGSRDGSSLELRPFDLGANLSLPDLATGYVDLRLDRQPGAGAVSVWVNGVLAMSNFAGHASDSGTYALWGAGASAQTGGANFSLIQVTAVPEPGTWALWLGGIAALAALHRRRLA